MVPLPSCFSLPGAEAPGTEADSGFPSVSLALLHYLCYDKYCFLPHSYDVNISLETSSCGGTCQ